LRKNSNVLELCEPEDDCEREGTQTMIEIKFSAQSTGACPICKRFDNCHILQALRKTLAETCSPVSDDTMELVVYRCPEFKEKL